MMKKLLMGTVFLLLNGCAGQSHYYVLSTAKVPVNTYRYDASIGVEQVVLPAYMDKRKLTIATSSNQIVQNESALWAEDMDAGLTQRLISFLQKKFKQPRVFAYPWGVDTQPALTLRVQINRFIAQGDKVYLDANYLLINQKTKKSKAYLFNVSVPTDTQPQNIVNAMDNAFELLQSDIAQNVK